MTPLGFGFSISMHLSLYFVAWLIFQVALSISGKSSDAWMAVMALSGFEYLLFAGTIARYKSVTWSGPRLQRLSWTTLLVALIGSTTFFIAGLFSMRSQPWPFAIIPALLSVLIIGWLFSALHEGASKPTPKQLQELVFSADAGRFIVKVSIIFVVFPVLARVFLYLMIIPVTLLGSLIPTSRIANLAFGAYFVISLGVAFVSAFKICRKAWPKAETSRA